MKKYFINGGKKLQGSIKVNSAKNSVLPIIAACILNKDITVIKNAPMLDDVIVICDVLRSLGADISVDREQKVIKIDTRELFQCEPPSEMIRKMRASFLIMGPMIARFGGFKISLPGGCNIGTRPIDLHLKGFKALGAEVNPQFGVVEARAEKLKGNRVYLDFPSVGATENIMMAAVLADGETVIENAAEEPEIEDLANFLRTMGAKIIGAGTGTIVIEGVKKLKGVEYTPMFDRIEAGTFMVAAAITRSKIKLENVNEKHIKSMTAKLAEMGIGITSGEDYIIVEASEELKPIDIKTMPYPGFPTDMQAQIMALLTTVTGTSIITETIFENRFMHVNELTRMGANIKIDGRNAIIEGIESLSGCEVKATDLRAGAALILAGLVAEGSTTIVDIYHIQRGYEEIEKKLQGVGADINIIDV
ncbi:UDP-N-acetylglucosamine 1-carboxyvinyltransferase [Clostridium cellulovorans]|uniref:UDP-N-acetylglucosamine 1-carboxyvinyltransferase n=1 Tax=Clostridium cellulovorans (strain ATCC 35296 / DSM 3052 / OCM 3 / 743B) TaxID=573061 RepID=D9STK2_CLOC7|nr:UDP-N-acetylglucosamine 1-carboxyvinyltransferase [Clostridium cellulovorans]ADL52736.1 UDP-N-acetylglucosamine 1-carboxyvinyltransferase [Clostridium cellulovorans 743B]